MKRIYFMIATCILLMTVNAGAQNTKKIIVSPKKDAVVGYTFLVKIEANGKSQISVVTGYELMDLDNSLLKKALGEYISMQTPQPGRKPVRPRVFIQPDPTLDFKTVLEVIKTARAADPAEIKVEIPNGPQLSIPPEPKSLQNENVKPNPLMLVVQLREQGNITLNNDKYGTLSDLSPLVKKLIEIFRERETNGVFREDTNEVEKTVFIKMPSSAKFADLVKIAKALEDAGAGPIGLQVDEAVNERMVLETVPTLPPPKKKPNR